MCFYIKNIFIGKRDFFFTFLSVRGKLLLIPHILNTFAYDEDKSENRSYVWKKKNKIVEIY